MKKNKIFLALLIIGVIATLNFMSFENGKNGDHDITLLGASAVACENMEGMSGNILLMTECMYDFWYEDENGYWQHLSGAGCIDYNSTCSI